MKLTSPIKRIVVAAGLAVLASGSWAAPVITLPVTDTSGSPTTALAPTSAPVKAQGEFRDTLVPDSIKTDGFSSYALTPGEPPPGTQSTLDMRSTIGAVLTSIDGGGRIVDASTTNAADGRFDTTQDANKRWWLTAYSFSLTFSGQVSAFGFYGTDFGDFEGQFEILLFSGDQQIATRTIPTGTGGTMPANGTNGWLQFYSIFDNEDVSFDRVLFKITQANPLGDPGEFDFLGFDDFVVGRFDTGTGGNVPEPGSLALVGASLLGLAAVRRRKLRA